jgi:hypothetical protein
MELDWVEAFELHQPRSVQDASQNGAAQIRRSDKRNGRRDAYLDERIDDCIVVDTGIFDEPGPNEETGPTKRPDITKDTGLIPRIESENLTTKSASDAPRVIWKRGEVVFQVKSPHSPQPFVNSISPREARSSLPLRPGRTPYTPSQGSTYPKPMSFLSAQTNDPTFTDRPLRHDRARVYFTTEQLEELESMSQKGHYPSPQMKKELSEALGIDPVRIAVGSERLLSYCHTDV